MIWVGKDIIETEKKDGEPVMRTCWECRPDKESRKKINRLAFCMLCNSYYVAGIMLSTIEKEEDFVSAMRGLGLYPGESTQKLML